MAQSKSVPTDESVEQFLDAIADERRRQDSFTLLRLMREPPAWIRCCGAGASWAAAAIIIGMRAGVRAT